MLSLTMVSVILIDDEQHCLESLQWLLDEYCPELNVVAIANDGESALPLIRQHRPGLIFLDVEMPGMNGFKMLEALEAPGFEVIFTTAFDHYAIRAIKFSALDYLLKPVDKDELRAAVDKFLAHTEKNNTKQLTALFTHLKNNDRSLQKIALPTLHGYELVALDQILFCESSSNYTDFKLAGGGHLLVSRTLKDIEQLLDCSPFFRTHHSFIVNLQHVVRYVRGEGGHLVINNGATVPVSRSKKEDLLKLITQLSA